MTYSGVLFPRRGSDEPGGALLPRHQEDDVPVQQGQFKPTYNVVFVFIILRGGVVERLLL